MTATMADKVEREYIQLIQFDIIQEKFKSYNRNKSRLDHFWIEVLECVGIENYSNIFSFIKKNYDIISWQCSVRTQLFY